VNIALKIDTENKSPIKTSNSMRESSTIAGRSTTKLAYQKYSDVQQMLEKCVAHRTPDEKSRKVKKAKITFSVQVVAKERFMSSFSEIAASQSHIHGKVIWSQFSSRQIYVKACVRAGERKMKN
jgi:hypothetical protein